MIQDLSHIKIEVEAKMELDTAQRTRLSEFSAEASVDLHSHCLPGLDDGPPTMDDSIALCRALVNDGITHVIATPHQLGEYSDSNERDAVLAVRELLEQELNRQGIPLVVKPGADVRIDGKLLPLLDDSRVLTLADTRKYILLEFPHESLIELSLLLAQLKQRGICGIISHPERQAQVARKPELVVPWLREGAILQVTAASLSGEFGADAFSAAWRLIEAGAVSLIASDAHDIVRRPPRMTQAIHLIAKRVGHAVARRLCIENPLKVLTGQPILPPRVSRRFGGGV